MGLNKARGRGLTERYLGRIEFHSLPRADGRLSVSRLSNRSLGVTICGRHHLRFVNRTVQNVSILHHKTGFRQGARVAPRDDKCI